MPDIPVTPPQQISTTTFGRYYYSVSGDSATTFAAPTGSTSTNVKVFLGGNQIQPDDANYGWYFDNDNNNVVFNNEPPLMGEVVIIIREVHLDLDKTEFPSGYTLDSRMLNRAILQALYQAQGIWEGVDELEAIWAASSDLAPPESGKENDAMLATQAGIWDQKLKIQIKNILNLQNTDDVTFNSKVELGSLSGTEVSATSFEFDIVSGTVSSMDYNTFLGVANNVTNVDMKVTTGSQSKLSTTNPTLVLDGSSIHLATYNFYGDAVVGTDGNMYQDDPYANTALIVDSSGHLIVGKENAKGTYNTFDNAYTTSIITDKLHPTDQCIVSHGRAALTSDQGQKFNSPTQASIKAQGNIPEIIVHLHTSAFDLDWENHGGFGGFISRIGFFYEDFYGIAPENVRATGNRLLDVRRIWVYNQPAGTIGNEQVNFQPAWWMKFSHPLTTETNELIRCMGNVSVRSYELGGTDKRQNSKPPQCLVGGSDIYETYADNYNNDNTMPDFKVPTREGTYAAADVRNSCIVFGDGSAFRSHIITKNGTPTYDEFVNLAFYLNTDTKDLLS